MFVEFELGWDGSTISLWKDGGLLFEFTDQNPCNELGWVGVTSYDSRNRRNPIDSWWIFREDDFGKIPPFFFIFHDATKILTEWETRYWC